MAGFELKADNRRSFAPFDNQCQLLGLACHQACYTLLVDRLKYRLKMRDVRHLAGGDFEALLMGGDYGGILKYQEQVQPCFPENAVFKPFSCSTGVHSKHVFLSKLREEDGDALTRLSEHNAGSSCKA